MSILDPNEGATLAQRRREAGRVPIKKRTHLPEDASPFAVSTRIKLEVLAVLHEGSFTAGEIADIIDEDVKKVTNHLVGLLKAGCIEVAGEKVEGNFSKTVYRAIARPYIDLETYRAMSLDERHDLNSGAIQWFMTECLLAYRNGKMDNDENVCLLSDEPCLDLQGRREMHDNVCSAYSGEPQETLDALKGIQEIEARAANRMAESGETGTTMVVALFVFERGRSSKRPKGSLRQK